MTVGSLCNRNVATIGPDANIEEAGTHMRESHVGDLIVVEHRSGRTVPIGIITDRDLIMEVIAEHVDATQLKIADVMSRNVVTVQEDNGLQFALHEMAQAGVRRLPVVDHDGALVGVLSIDDIIEYMAKLAADVAQTFRTEQRKESHTRP